MINVTRKSNGFVPSIDVVRQMPPFSGGSRRRTTAICSEGVSIATVMVELGVSEEICIGLVKNLCNGAKHR